VVSDRKHAKTTSGTNIEWFEADVVSSQQYYPFGMLMPADPASAATRQYAAGGYDHRYGFNGKEGDDEVRGDDNQQDYGMRGYGVREGRFWSVDPIAGQYPELTPYQFASNTPISGIDLDGLEYFFAADGAFLGRSGSGTQVRVAKSGQEEFVRNYVGWTNDAAKAKNENYRSYNEAQTLNASDNLAIDIKDFLDRSHFTYGEGGGTDAYQASDGAQIDPAQFFADAIQNGVDYFGSEETMKIKMWKNAKKSYREGTIQTEGKKDSPYNVFNDARTAFEDGDPNAFATNPAFNRVLAANIKAIKEKDTSDDSVYGAYQWVGGMKGDTWSGRMINKNRWPTVIITTSTRWSSWKPDIDNPIEFLNTTTFYKFEEFNAKKDFRSDKNKPK
jgi:RHS repeat-associated protein